MSIAYQTKNKTEKKASISKWKCSPIYNMLTNFP